MVSKEFIPYEEALALKELGFNEKECLGFWSKIHGLFITKTTGELNENAGECKAPLYQQAFRWFREKHSLFHVITIADLGKYETGDPDFQCAIYSKDPVVITNIDTCNTYEEAELECLRKLIEIVNQNKDG